MDELIECDSKIGMGKIGSNRPNDGKQICRTCMQITDESVKIQFDNGLPCGPHHDSCFSDMVSKCRSRSW